MAYDTHFFSCVGHGGCSWAVPLMGYVTESIGESVVG